MASTLDEIRTILIEWDTIKQEHDAALEALHESYESEIRSLDDRRRAKKASSIAAKAAETARRNNEVRKIEREFEVKIRDAERRNREALESISERLDILNSIESKIPNNLLQRSVLEGIDCDELFDVEEYDKLLEITHDASFLSSARRLFVKSTISPIQAANKVRSMLKHDRDLMRARKETLKDNAEVEDLRQQLRNKIEEIIHEKGLDSIPYSNNEKDDYETARKSIKKNYEAEKARIESAFANESLDSIVSRCRNIALQRSEELDCTPRRLASDYECPRNAPEYIFDYWRLIKIGDQHIPVPHSYESRYPSNYLFVSDDQSELALRSMRSAVAFLIKKRPLNDMKIIWLDAVTMGMSLGVLAELASPISSEKETIVKAASSQREIDLAIAELEYEMGSRSLRIASSGNIWDYNDGTSNRIPYLVIVGIGLDDKQYEKRYIETLAKAADCSRTLGIQFILSVNTDALCEDKAIPIKALAANCEIIETSGDSPVQRKGDDCYTLLFPGENWIKAHLVDPLISRSNKISVEKKPLPEKIDIDRDGLLIPLGWQNNGEIAYLDYSDYAHAFLAGRTGSGKSVFLHNVITRACERYSPDELQICLVDYKKSEFGIYRDDRYCFPNIVFIGLDNTRGFVEALMKYLVATFHDRQEQINRDNSRDISKYNNTHEEKIPRLLIIMDEFHRQSSLTDYAGESARNLEFLLRESRAYGMHFLIADQEIGNLAGLSDSAKKQLGGRIQLDWTETSELLNMFELAGCNLGVNKLEPGQAIFKIDGNLEMCTWPFVSEEDIAKSKTLSDSKWTRKEELIIQDSDKPLRIALSNLPSLPTETIPIGTTANFLDPLVGISLARRRRENIFILNKNMRMTVDLVCALALGFVRCRNASRIVLMSFKEELFYSENTRYWQALSDQCEFIQLLSMSEICTYCKSGPSNSDFLIIAGIDAIAECLEDANIKDNGSVDPEDQSPLESIDERLDMLLSMEKEEEAEALDRDEDNALIYDARSDLLGIVKSGGSRDVHVCSVSDTVFNLYSTFGANSMQDDFKDLFPYRIAPSCEYSEAASLGIIEAATAEIDDTSVYMVTKAGTKEEFRPFNIEP